MKTTSRKTKDRERDALKCYTGFRAGSTKAQEKIRNCGDRLRKK
jgi:hypothetical protein